MAENKYYWLKLKRDFFKRHDIRIIEAMPNGKDYILFYLKLLCESVDHNGALRFSETIPYNAEMLSVITNTNIDIVKSAIKTFAELNMMEFMDNGTLYMSEVESMIGCETEWAKKKREYRDKQRLKEDNVLPLSDKSKSIEIEKEKDIDKDNKGKKPKAFTPPTLEEIQAYIKERGSNVDAKRFFDYYEQGGWKDSSGKPVRNWKQKMIAVWEKDKPATTPAPKKNSFNDYPQTDVDYDELRRKCFAN